MYTGGGRVIFKFKGVESTSRIVKLSTCRVLFSVYVPMHQCSFQHYTTHSRHEYLLHHCNVGHAPFESPGPSHVGQWHQTERSA